MAERQFDIVMSHCNKCGGKRNHTVLHKEEKNENEQINEIDSIGWWDCYEMLKCCGCDGVSMRHRHSFSEDTNEYGEPNIHITYFPSAISRRKPRWMDDFSFSLNFGIDPIKDILDEVYVCLQNNAPRLATMGVRSLIEHIIIDKVGDQGTFASNISKFMEEGYISEIQKQILEKALDAGHAVTHRSFRPDNDLVGDVVDIAESLIEMLYVNPSRSRRIAKKTPARKKKNLSASVK